ncbi:hypothetical protein [Pseudoxanthomonas japonensis]|uniref:hypothetical protein n=1 Tax=Pseudoxanthomonas japonensis TaxID=69284 RepID=UPI001BCCC7BC|nr:hypothetical protein [Pseudoxanthomonas japonensis]
MEGFELDRFNQLVELLNQPGDVGECLPYSGMASVPVGFNEFVRRDWLATDATWSDVCPAYALALVSVGSYGLPQDDPDMEVLWDELGGSSTKLWPEVRDLIKRSWAWLDAHHPVLDTQGDSP